MTSSWSWSRLRDSLSQLGYPNLDQVDERVVTSGREDPERRSHLLAWLLEQWDAQLMALAKQSHGGHTTLQLVLVAHMMGLCEANDMRLIEGRGHSEERQLEFFGSVVSMVLGRSPRGSSAQHDQRWDRDQRLLQHVAQHAQSVFTPSLPVVPEPARAKKRRSRASGAGADTIPSVAQLAHTCAQVGNDVALLQQRVLHLQQSAAHVDNADLYESERTSHSKDDGCTNDPALTVALKRLAVVLDQFNRVYREEMGHWAPAHVGKQEPSVLAETAQQVAQGLLRLDNVATKVRKLQLCHEGLSQLPLQQLDDLADNFGEARIATLNSVISVLQQAMQRDADVLH